MRKTILWSLILWTSLSFGQDFNKNVQDIQAELQTVESGKKSYEQSIESVAPGVVSIQITETDSKGKTKSYTFLFNLADIDPHTVKAFAKKDLITVNLTARKKQKLIQKTLDESKTSYISNFYIYGADMDNGRALAENIKKAIPVAQKLLEKRLSLHQYNDRLDWLQEHIGAVDYEKKKIEQELTPKDTYPGVVRLHKKIIGGKSDKNITYEFNLANLNPKSVNFVVKGNTFGLKIATKQGLKLIKVTENGVQKPYVNKIDLACKDVEQARDIQKVLTDIIPLAQQKWDKAVPNISNVSTAFDKLNELNNTVSANEQQYEQNFEGDCIVTFTQKSITPKKTTEDVYSFNLIDIQKKNIKPKTKGKFIVLEIKTKGSNKFIQHTKDGELGNYVSGLKIYTSGPEEALISQKALQNSIEICQNKYQQKQKQSQGFNQAFSILKENMQNFDIGDTSYEQEINLKEDNKKLEYKRIEGNAKGSKEYLYEVNLSDLAPKSVKIKVSGKKVMLEIGTKHLEKLIQYYKDGKIQSYQNKILIMAPDIETARKMKQAFQNMLKK